MLSMGYPTEIRAANKRPSKPVKVTKAKANPRPQYPTPFDPDDLTRRLYAVLAEQKTQAERKRRARTDAEKRTHGEPKPRKGGLAESSQPKINNVNKTPKAHAVPKPSSAKAAQSDHARGSTKGDELHRSTSKSSKENDADEPKLAPYHHVPQVAASQFAVTTNSDRLGELPLVHKLSRPAMKFHMEGPNASREVAELGADASPTAQVRALRRAQSQRERQYDRNHFQQTHSLRRVQEAEDRENGEAPQRHTFEAQERPTWVENTNLSETRRQSTGTMLAKTLGRVVEGQPLNGMSHGDRLEPWSEQELAVIADDHRVDWTQSDEAAPRLERSAPRKQESRWNLRARISSSAKQSKPPSEGVTQGESEKHKFGFFARFKH
ncbi:hypothetical protein S40293_05396 [Stachybotrys chartarum IBT 40293]|nr:hypothetical protein S40293_05396 [Stachybotrys chartarum IBT 40293]